jgi:hypothetical protein
VTGGLRLRELLDRLAASEVRFVIVGGLAVNAWGYVRGTWGGLGRVFTLPDIAAFGIVDAGRRYGEQRLAERRREQASALLEAAQAKQAAPA